MTELEPLDPLNAGTPLSRLAEGAMPVARFYTRSNFEVPIIDPDGWRLTVDGLVGKPASFALNDLKGLGQVSRLVTLECAGNGRTRMDPTPSGAPWGLGAVSVAEFTGVPLGRVLRAMFPSAGALEYVFTGADRGSVVPEGDINYAFSLRADAAVDGDSMLAWAMNGEPLTPEHGAPLRLVVPGEYGMNSVKWLTTITAIAEPFTGHFRMKYRYLGDPVAAEGENVGPMRVRSLIVSPSEGDQVVEQAEVRGIAWSGSGSIESVEVQIDAGDWMVAGLGSRLGRFAPTPWSLDVSLASGVRTIRARATDSAGNRQPLESIWNANGYGNNVVHAISVLVS